MAAMTFRRTAVLATIAFSLAVAQTRVVHALSPTVVMFYGAPLAKPVIVSGADTLAFGDLTRRAPMTAADMGARKFITVALFWGPAHDPALNGSRLDQLTPTMAWQHGRFYPPADGQPAALFAMALSKFKSEGTRHVIPVPTNAFEFMAGGPLPALPAALLARVTATR